MGVLYKKTNGGNKWLGQPTGTPNVIPASAGLVIPAGDLLVLESVELQNRYTSAAAAALVGYLPDALWTAGQWTALTTTFTDDTTDAQDVGTGDFALETTTNDDGVLFSAVMPFGAIGLDITTASVGSPVRVIEYWNGAWTAIAAAGMLVDIPRSSAQWTAAENLVLFDPPMDWVVGGSGTGVPATAYNLLIRATTAPSTAALAKRAYLGVPLFSIDALAVNGSYMPALYAPVVVGSPIEAVGLAVGTADAGSNMTLIYHWRG